LADRRGLAREDQEGCLESVLGVVRVVQQPLAETQHHHAVPPDEHLEGRVALAGDEVVQQLRLGPCAAILPPHPTDQAEQLPVCHVVAFTKSPVY
jgi:hypothetical protein